jgi:hypothetical protein
MNQGKSMRKNMPRNPALSESPEKNPLLHEELHKKNAFPNHETRKETLGERGAERKGRLRRSPLFSEDARYGGPGFPGTTAGLLNREMENTMV